MKFDLHHIHRRKRASQSGLEPYPHPDKWIRALDKSMVVIAIIGPLFNIPQIMKIFLEHTAAGLAMSTWVLLLVMKIPWIAYAVVHKEVPLLVTSILWAFSHVIIITGIVIYG